MVVGQRTGLRERKRLAVRHALGTAALRLAVGRGLDNVTIEDITAEADVSRRTFGNYFSSKYEAICAVGTDRARRIGADLLARPADEALWEALAHAVMAHYEGAGEESDGEWLAGLKLVLTATWAAADPPVPLRPLLRRALDQLAVACSGADRYLTEEEFKALVRPAIFGPNGPLCEPPGSR